MPDIEQLVMPQYLRFMMYRSMTFKSVDVTLTKGGKSIQTKGADVNLSTFSHSVTIQRQS